MRQDENKSIQEQEAKDRHQKETADNKDQGRSGKLVASMGIGGLVGLEAGGPPGAFFGALAGGTYYLLEEHIDSYHNIIQQRIDANFHAEMARSAPNFHSFKDESDRFKRLDALNAMVSLSYDNDVPESTQNYYRDKVTRATVEELRTMYHALEANSLKAVGLPEKFSKDFDEVRIACDRFANDIITLKRDVDAGNISAREYSSIVLNKIKDVDKVAHQCLMRTKKISDNQNIIMEKVSTLSKLQEKMQNDLSFVFEQATRASDISGLDHIPSVRRLYAEYNQLKERGASPQILINCKKQLEQEIIHARTIQANFIESKNDLSHLCSIFSAVAQISGNGILSSQISAVGLGTISVFENMLGLFGSSLVASISPFAAIGNIVSVAAKLMSVFGVKRSKTNPSVAILNAIHKLSQQIEALRNEMQEKFDEVLAKLSKQHRQVLSSFCLLANEQRLTLSVIRLTFLSMYKQYDDVKASIEVVASDIREIKDIMIFQPIGNDRDSLVAEKNFLLSYPVTDYSRHANTIDTIGLDFSITHQPNDPLSVSKIGLSPKDYLHFPNYYASLFTRYSQESTTMSSLGDPHILVPAALIKALLDSKQFPKPDHENHHLRMPIIALEKLYQYLSMLEDLTNFMISLRGPEFIHEILTLTSKILLRVGQELDGVFQATISEEINRDEQALGLLLEQRRSELNHAAIKNTVIVDTHGWFEGKTYHAFRLHSGKRWQAGCNIAGEYNDKESKAKYKQLLETQIEEQKAEALKKTNEAQIVVRNTKPNPFEKQGNLALHGVRYVRPMNDKLPYLPAPTSLFRVDNIPIFMRLASLAQTFRCGDIELVYEIKDKNTFCLHIEFAYANTNKVIATDRLATLSLPFDDFGFQQSEAVWYYWFGGELPPDTNGTMVHKVTGKRLFKWEHLVDKCSRDALYSQVCQIAGNAGAYGHKAGEFEYSGAEYKIPGQFVKRVGIYDLLPTLNPDQITVSVNSEAESRLEAIKSGQESKFFMRCKQAFAKKLSMNSETHSGKACSLLEQSFRDLFGLLSFAYHDTLSKNSPLRQWFMTNIMSLDSLKEVYLSSSILQSPSEILRETFSNMSLLKKIIADLRESLTQSVDCEFLTNAMSKVDTLIVCNQPYVESTQKDSWPPSWHSFWRNTEEITEPNSSYALPQAKL